MRGTSNLRIKLIQDDINEHQAEVIFQKMDMVVGVLSVRLTLTI